MRVFAALSVAALLMPCGCTCSDGVTQVACDVEGCHEPCSTEIPCAKGLYCDAMGMCTRDCEPDGTGCDSDEVCNEFGQCEVKGADGPDGCPGVNVSLDPITPLVILLIDQSGSMTEPFGDGLDRWEAMEQALVDPDVGVVATLESSVIFGAALYTSFNGFDGGECPVLTTVSPMLDNYVAIHDLFANNSPEDDTPTGESILAALPLFDEAPLDPKSPTPLYLLLATDGEPDTCEVPDPQEGQAVSVAAAQTTFKEGITTIVLSVGSEVGADHLQDMANAGVGLEVGGSENAPYYVANSPEELADALGEIIRGTRSCEFELGAKVFEDQAPDGEVLLDGAPLEHGVGWELVDSDTMTLLGEACDTWLNQDSVSLTATFPCGAIIVE